MTASIYRPVVVAHPDDIATCRRLCADLRTARERSQLRMRTVAAHIGRGHGCVYRVDAGRDNVRVSVLQRYAAAVGHRIDFHLHLLPGTTAGRAHVDTLGRLAAAAATTDVADTYERAAVQAAIGDLRRHLGLTQAAAGALLGRSEAAVCRQDREDRDTMLGTYLRTARAYGYPLTVTLEAL